jgi:cell division transport system permease protein
MNWSTIRYILVQATKGMAKNPLNHAVALITVALAVLILNIFFLIFYNLDLLLERWQQEVEVTVYIKKGVSHSDQRAIRDYIAALDGVEEARLVSEEEALSRFRAELGPGQSLLEGLEGNPLPASVEVRLKGSVVREDKKLQSLIQAFRSIDGVEDVQAGQQLLRRLGIIKEGLGLVVLVIGGGIVLAIISIISNTIKLTVYARREEIEIMRLVGATDSFIRAPFLLEGMIHGGTGTIVSLALLGLGYLLVAPTWNENLQGILLGLRISFLPADWLWKELVAGVVVGAMGSFFSVSRFLRE